MCGSSSPELFLKSCLTNLVMKVLFCHRVTPALKEHYRKALPKEIDLIFPKKLSESEYLKYAPDVDVIVGYRFSEELLKAAKGLKHIQIPWTGAETLDFNLGH